MAGRKLRSKNNPDVRLTRYHAIGSSIVDSVLRLVKQIKDLGAGAAPEASDAEAWVI